MDQALGIGEKEIEKGTAEKDSQPLKAVSKEKRSLSDQLLDATKRRASIGTDKIPIKQKETQFYR